MKNYVVAIISFFENNIKQFKVEADSEYDAVKKAMLEFTSEEYRQDEIDFQKSKDYPQTIEEMNFHFGDCDMDVSVIEI